MSSSTGALSLTDLRVPEDQGELDDEDDHAARRVLTGAVLLGWPVYSVIAMVVASFFDAPLTDHPHLSAARTSEYVFAAVTAGGLCAPFVAAALMWRVMRRAARHRALAVVGFVVALLELMTLPLPILLVLELFVSGHAL